MDRIEDMCTVQLGVARKFCKTKFRTKSQNQIQWQDGCSDTIAPSPAVRHPKILQEAYTLDLLCPSRIRGPSKVWQFLSLSPSLHAWSFSAGGTVALAGAAILGLHLGPLALAASAGLLVILPCTTGLAVQAALPLLIVGLAGLGCGWEHLTTATALEPSRIFPGSLNLLLRLVLACFTGNPCRWHRGHVWPELALQGRRGLALAALKVMSLAPAAFEAELPDTL